jgi:Thioredoxin like C-terminal domain
VVHSLTHAGGISVQSDRGRPQGTRPDREIRFRISNHRAVLNKRRVYAAPARLDLNHSALSGDCTVKQRSIVLNQANGRIAYRFHARDLHLVMGRQREELSVDFAYSSPPEDAKCSVRS